jgi:hypothetical protein
MARAAACSMHRRDRGLGSRRTAGALDVGRRARAQEERERRRASEASKEKSVSHVR